MAHQALTFRMHRLGCEDHMPSLYPWQSLSHAPGWSRSPKWMIFWGRKKNSWSALKLNSSSGCQEAFVHKPPPLAKWEFNLKSSSGVTNTYLQWGQFWPLWIQLNKIFRSLFQHDIRRHSVFFGLVKLFFFLQKFPPKIFARREWKSFLARERGEIHPLFDPC